jgi:hypothetical protein
VVDDGRVECTRFTMTDAGRRHVERDPGGCYTGGIDAHSARGWVVRQNRFESIFCAGEGLAEHAAGFFSSVDYRFANSVVTLANNLTRRITVRDGATATLATNVETTDLSLFANAAAADVHLTAGAAQAIDLGTAETDAGLDIDGDPHTSGAPDIGADER